MQSLSKRYFMDNNNQLYTVKRIKPIYYQNMDTPLYTQKYRPLYACEYIMYVCLYIMIINTSKSICRKELIVIFFLIMNDND